MTAADIARLDVPLADVEQQIADIRAHARKLKGKQRLDLLTEADAETAHWRRLGLPPSEGGTR
ncbi:hypothetical protein [Streptomyces sp. NPDC004330]|uniref:hypothetical protein n=1 Tax=Streptomyces sp. NPDC004330 TaxID=3364700 RepID=UPI0036C22EAD